MGIGIGIYAQFFYVNSNEDKFMLGLGEEAEKKETRKKFLVVLTEHEKGLQERIELYEKDLDELEKKILQATLSSINEEYIGGELAWPLPRI